MLEENLAVVYVIFDKSTDQALYVGRTKKLRRRLYTNHLQGNKSTARLKKYLVEDSDRFPQIINYEQAKLWLKENCYFKYTPVDESRERGQIEDLLSFVFDVLYIEDEH
jgi:excinuclease UvrABC nuclease subunit